MNKSQIQSIYKPMDSSANSEFNLASPFQMAFHRKPHTHLIKLLKYNHFQECLRKTVNISKADRLIFDEVVVHLKEFLRDGVGSEAGTGAASIETGERGEELYYDITRCFIKCNTLKECLLGEKPLLNPNPFTALLTTYLHTLLLNHTLFSTSNLFLAHKTWTKHPTFELNYTSVGFLFDSLTGRGLCHADLAEYANYLPAYFYQEGTVKKRFNFRLKLRSLAVNLLSIVLHRDIDFIHSHAKAALYSEEQITLILLKIHSNFQEFLKNALIQKQINAVSASLDVDLLPFFKVAILSPQLAESKQFNSWAKVARYFKHPLLAEYQKIFQLELSNFAVPSEPPTTYLQEWVRHLWMKEDKYIKRRFCALGIVGEEESTDDLILYVLYKHRLINGPYFAHGKEAYHPGFIKQAIALYQQIIESDFLLEHPRPDQLQEAKVERNERLLIVVDRLDENLNEMSIKNGPNEKFLFVAKDGIDLKLALKNCWHFR